MGSEKGLEVSLTFLGATGTVTGSKTLLSVNRKKYLVDCGIYQGPKEIRNLNREPFPGGASEIDAVILTHAHIDHSGYLPCLVRDGFHGPVYCSQATADLCEVMLMDAAWLQEEDAAFADRSRHSRHYPAKPLFTRVDAQKALEHLKPLGDDQWIALDEQVSLNFRRSGHILGSRFASFSISDQYKKVSLTFSGDLGNGRSEMIKGPVSVTDSEYLILESTYGDRIHDDENPSDSLQAALTKTYERGGVVVIPAFSVGRTQELLYLIGSLKKKALIPPMPVYLDSPMSNRVTEIYRRFPDELRLHVSASKSSVILPEFNDYHTVQSADDSMLLCMQDGPFVVISAAGMLTGGRVLHHLKRRLPDEKNMVIFCGYQAAETKGRLLQEGISSLRIHHQEVPVNAEIFQMEPMSAHADQNELVGWMNHFRNLKTVFLNHGEPAQIEGLRQRIVKEKGKIVEVPQMNQKIKLL